MLKPASGEPAKPTPGEVVALDPIQVNLADGHYLSIGISLQGVKGAKELDGSKALDATIELFSGQKMEPLTKQAHREELKKELAKELEHLYEGEVMDVYFTQFVTQ
jgi:flagellar protein FliL